MAFRRLLIPAALLILTTTIHSSTQHYDPANQYAYLDSIRASGADDLDDYLIRKLETFVSAHPGHDNAPDALLMLAQIWDDRGKETVALGRYTQTLFLYPESEAAALAAEGRDRMMTKIGNYDPEFLRPPADAPANRTEREFALLKSLSALEDKDLAPVFQNRLHEFMEAHADYAGIEAVYRWSAETYALTGDKEEARAAYDHYTALFPKDEHLPMVRTLLAVLLEEQFGDEDAAYDAYSRVVENWPESDYSAHALLRRAELAEDDRRDYRAAIDDYRLLITKWPSHERAVEALYKIAQIKEERLDAHISAIETYNEFVRTYPEDPRAVKALKRSSEIYAKRLGDYANAALQLARIGREYPEHDDAIPMLMEASDIAIEKLDDYDMAIGFLKEITEGFRDRIEARQAQLRINKLMIAKTEAERQ